MSLRIFNIALLALALAACSNDGGEAGQSTGDEATAATQAEANADDKGSVAGSTIHCALNGATEPTPVCKRTTVQNGDLTQMVLEGPEGDFRRFNILTDGRGLEAADGAEMAQITLLDDGKIQVKVADDVYLLPATVKKSTSAPTPEAEPLPTAPAQ